MTFLVDALAAYRLTVLVVRDEIMSGPRNAVREWANRRRPTSEKIADALYLPVRHPKIAYLVECPWCVGVYAGLGVVAFRRLVPRLADPILRGLAVSAIVGLVAETEMAITAD